MSSTPNKLYTNQLTGTNSGTWGIVLNSNFSIIDNNLGGTLTLSVAGNSNVTLTAAQAQNLIYNFTGALTGNIEVIFPAQGGLYFINNQTTGAYTLTIQAGASVNGFLVPQGQQAPVYVDNSTTPPTVGGASGTQYIYTTGIVGGTANALTVSQTFPSNFSLNTGIIVTIIPTNDNTGSATLDINGTGALEIVKVGATGLVALQAGDLFEDIPITVQYNGTNWTALSIVYFGETPTQESSGFALAFNNWMAPIICTTALICTIPQASLNFTYFFRTQITAGNGAVTFTPYSTDIIWVNGVALSAGTSYVMPSGATADFSTDANGNIYLAVSNLSSAVPTTGRLLNIQHFLSGGTYTPTAGTNTVKITACGGGGGGGGSTGSGGTGATNGGGGGTTSVGSLISCGGGAGGALGVSGATASAGTGGSIITANILPLTGSSGTPGVEFGLGNNSIGGNGAPGIFGAGSGISIADAAGGNGAPNTGAGGGGGSGVVSGTNGGAGGGAGGFGIAYIGSISGTYSVTIGTAGTAGGAGSNGGFAGGTGGTGVAIIEEYS